MDTPEITHTLKPGLGRRDEQFANKLREYFESGEAPEPQSAMGQQMSRKFTDEERAQLKGMSNIAKIAFRKEWVKRQHHQYFVVKQVQEKSWKKVDLTRGIYMSASKVFAEEGGTVHDLEAAKKIVNKCVLMGAPFCVYNEWSERYDFLYLRKEFKESMTKAWSLFQESRSSGDAANKRTHEDEPEQDSPNKRLRGESEGDPKPEDNGTQSGTTTGKQQDDDKKNQADDKKGTEGRSRTKAAMTTKRKQTPRSCRWPLR